MNRLLLVAFTLLLTLTAQAQVHVRGYTKSNGTYVAPYTRSSPNSSRTDNYSARGNYNPYTGNSGTTNPYARPAYRPNAYVAPANSYYSQPRPAQRSQYQYQYQQPQQEYGGNRCASDCSGHDAGYAWAEQHGITDSSQCGGGSQSFIEGCATFADEQSN